jgi:tRNA pseudouridine55 synthase
LSIKPANTEPSGLLLIDKPAGISSFDIIRALRRQTGVRKIGHAGTLDPMATGLMLMLVGTATKQAGRLSGLDKSYVAEMTLGATSATGDREGELTAVSGHKPSQKELESALGQLVGDITQTPSPYSAIKVHGVRAYKLARAGKTVEMPPRQVTIYAIKLLDYSYPTARFEVRVSSGTYIRTLAEDIGEQLGTGAYLSALRRITVGTYEVNHAQDLSALTAPKLVQVLISI